MTASDPRAELKPSDRALLDEACDLLRGCAPLTWMHRGNMNDAAEYERTIVAFLDRARALDAAQPASSSASAQTLPVEVRGQWYEVPIPVHLRLVALTDQLACNLSGQAFIRDLLGFTAHCISAAEEGVDYAVPRAMLDAMTTLGLMEKVGRGKWSPTKAAEQFVRAANTNAAQPAGVAVDSELLLLAADFETCIPFLPEPGQRNIAKAVARLRVIASQVVAGSVPEAKYPDDGDGDEDAYNRGWNDCRATMLASAPPAPQPATAGQPPTDYGDSGSKSVVPTAEHWRRAVSDFVLEQGVHLAANDWTHIEQRAVALAREEGK
jgi:hypothetical protein